MKKIILVSLLLGLTSTVVASEETLQAKEWDEEVWESTFEAMPKGSVTGGEKIAKQGYCYACHGEKGVAPTNNAPSLAGMKVLWLYKGLLDYQSGLAHIDNKSLVMEAAAAPLTKQNMSDLAAYYNAQSLPKGVGGVKKPKKVRKCSKCHDNDDDGDGPFLMGQSSLYIVRQLSAYKHEIRRTELDNTMKKKSKKLKKKHIKELAEYYSVQ